MGRILLVWQLGGNLGHIVPLVGLGKALRSRGHQIAFAVENMRAAASLLSRHRFPFVQAPVLRSTAPDLPREPASYPEMLFHFGFADPDALTGAVRAWRELFCKLAPELIVFDHAPTALLAARGTGIPRVVFGTGFASPPRVSPMPSIRPWQQIPLERLEASEQRALDTANAALRAHNAPPLRVFHELFDVEENILATLPELDHYGARPNVRYWGPMFNDTEGSEPRWPPREGKKLFVYIRPNSAGFPPLVATLRNANLRTLWFAPGLIANARATAETPSLRFVAEPVDINAAVCSADAAVLHGGHGTTAATLLAGVPVLLLPEHIEQFVLGRNAAALGASATINVGALGSGLASILECVIHDARFSTNAQVFAAKYRSFDHARQQHELVVKLGRLAMGPNRGESEASEIESIA
ncbi:MAG TPA: nucleotide disphospho-sugar-binding domain-containing protein [Burkholderiales bacterium]|nr:nucleotide disphospho-sugar-binding domain-containing protein [Burkholderiales bacterium]